MSKKFQNRSPSGQLHRDYFVAHSTFTLMPLYIHQTYQHRLNKHQTTRMCGPLLAHRHHSHSLTHSLVVDVFLFMMIATTAVAGLLAVETITTLTGNCTFAVTFSLTKVLHSIDTVNLFSTCSSIGRPVSSR